MFYKLIYTGHQDHCSNYYQHFASYRSKCKFTFTRK